MSGEKREREGIPREPAATAPHPTPLVCDKHMSLVGASERGGLQSPTAATSGSFRSRPAANAPRRLSTPRQHGRQQQLVAHNVS